MNKTAKTALVALLALTLTATFAIAQRGQQGQRGQRGQMGQMGQMGQRQRGQMGQMMMGRGGGSSIMRALRSLDLTEQQQKQVQAFNEESRVTMTQIREALSKANQALQEAVKKEDLEAIPPAATAIGVATGNQAIANVHLQKKIKSILTKSQLTKLEQYYKDAEKRRLEMIKQMEKRRAAGGDTEGERGNRRTRGEGNQGGRGQGGGR